MLLLVFCVFLPRQGLLSFDGDGNDNCTKKASFRFFAVLYNEIILSIDIEILKHCNHLHRNLSLVKQTFHLILSSVI